MLGLMIIKKKDYERKLLVTYSKGVLDARQKQMESDAKINRDLKEICARKRVQL